MQKTESAIVIDLQVCSSTAAQVQHCEIKFCVARLDNQNELINQLALGENVTDADIILAAYKCYGTDCANYLLGDFAFAIWDGERNRVYAARDFIGCQPVYYCAGKQSFFIAENLAQLLENPQVSQEPDEPYIAAWLKRAFAHTERTGFSQIKKIPPGHFLVVDRRGMQLECYWRAEDVWPRKWEDHNACLAEFRTIVRQAVVDRLPESGRTGVHVSGGLDCSTLAIIASEELKSRQKKKPLALTWYPPPQASHNAFEKSEYERIDAVCDFAGIEPIYTIQSAQNIIDVLNRDSMIYPICNASYNEKLVLDEAEKNGVTTIISGFGGDEAASFDGRGYFQCLALKGRWLKLSKFAKGRGRNPFGFLLQYFFLGLSHKFFSEISLRRFENNLYGKRWSIWKAWFDILIQKFWRISHDENCVGSTTGEDETRPYLDKALENEVDALPPIKIVRMPNSKAARCNLLYWAPNSARIESWAADGAQRGIKYVYPLLDRRVVEFALSLPGNVFFDHQWKRLFFRHAMESILPHNVCWEKSKSDPARADPLIQAIREAFAQLHPQLARQKAHVSKAKYLDIERLVSDLHEERIGNRARLGRIIQAMEFVGTSFLHENQK